jgi:glutamate dehydrogenase/leucine dehydrogenase
MWCWAKFKNEVPEGYIFGLDVGLAELGAAVVAVSTSHGGIHNPDRLDVTTLLTLRGQHGDRVVAHYSDDKLSR